LIPEKLKTTRLKKRRKSKANENNNKKKLCLGKNKEQFPSPHIKDRRGNKNKEEKRPGEQEHIILKCEGRKAKKSGRTYGEGGLGGSSYQEPSDIHVLEGLKSTRKILKIEGGQLNSKNHPYLFRLTLSLSLRWPHKTLTSHRVDSQTLNKTKADARTKGDSMQNLYAFVIIV
jgi:hypothetical protein